MRALLVLLCACAEVTTLRYQPSKTSIANVADDRGTSVVPRPARGGTIAATLADGFPVWVVHHHDGTITVVGGVAPVRPKGKSYIRDDVSAQVGRYLVSWIPGVRRFYASGILFDEYGKVLGFAELDGCAGECSRIEDMPQTLRDLDTSDVTPTTDNTLSVGALVEGDFRLRARTWLPWRRAANREDDMTAANTPASPRRSLVDALKLADGQYATVDGETMRSTHGEPVICKTSNPCRACGPERLPLVGITSSDAAHIHRRGWWRDPSEYRRDLKKTYVEGQPGTFLVRRQGRGFQIVAGIFRGICGGSF